MPWHTLAKTADCPPGAARECIAADRIIALFNVEGQFHALDGLCPHQGGPLGKGQLAGCIVTCEGQDPISPRRAGATPAVFSFACLDHPNDLHPESKRLLRCFRSSP